MYTEAGPPPVHIACLALILNPLGEVLMVRPACKPGGFYRLPGGDAQADEPDWEALVREVREETGLTVVPRRLLVKDWLPANEDTGAAAGYTFVYDCGTVPEKTEIRLPAGRRPELDHFRWVPLHELNRRCVPYQARRVSAAVEARKYNAFMELSYGLPAYSTRPAA